MSLLAAAIVGAGTFLSLKYIAPSGKAKTPIDLGRKWLAWGCVLAMFVGFNFYMRHGSLGAFVGGALGAIIFIAPTAFVLGWTYGKLFRFRAENALQIPQPQNPEPARPISQITPQMMRTSSRSHIANRTSMMPAPPSTAMPSSHTGPSHQTNPTSDSFEIDEEAIYEQVANEVESGNVRKGLWTKLWAELDGDDAKVKLAYVKARATEIIINAQQALDKKIQERDREIALGNEYVTIIQKIKASTATREDKERLIEILGGTFSRAEPNSATNSQCKVSLAGKEHEFHTELEFAQWIESRLLPQIDNIDTKLTPLEQYATAKRLFGTIRERLALLKSQGADQVSNAKMKVLRDGTNTAFWNAVQVGLTKKVIDLVEKHPELLLFVDVDGNNPLRIAVQVGSVELARFLLECGVDPDQKNSYGVSARDQLKKNGTAEMHAIFQKLDTVICSSCGAVVNASSSFCPACSAYIKD